MVRHVGTLERLIDFGQHRFLLKIDGAQMRADRFKIRCSQR